jgi:hypothetical protein
MRAFSPLDRFLALLLLLLLLAIPARGRAEETREQIRLVTLVNSDDQGEKIGFPESLFYDRWARETYLISSTGRITIYNEKFFPVASFGAGRGVYEPAGIAVDRRGVIYVCQKGGKDGDSARLVLYNQAFFPIKEIVFAAIPELSNFVAHKVAVSAQDEIYLIGTDGRGGPNTRRAAVLDPAGKFLRFLVPAERDSRQNPEREKPAEEKTAPPADMIENEAGVEASLRPRSRNARSGAQDEEKRWPATIKDVKIDENGRIYLLSLEVSHIYVYDSREKYLFKFGIKGGVPSKLASPVSLAVDVPRQLIYVCDYMRHTILVYDYESGRYVFEFGGRGFSPLWFDFPNSVEVDAKGQVVISDLFNKRLQVIDPNMATKQLAQPPLPAGLAVPALPDEAPRSPAPAGDPAPPEPEAAGTPAVDPLSVAPSAVLAPTAALPGQPPAMQESPAPAEVAEAATDPVAKETAGPEGADRAIMATAAPLPPAPVTPQPIPLTAAPPALVPVVVAAEAAGPVAKAVLAAAPLKPVAARTAAPQNQPLATVAAKAPAPKLPALPNTVPGPPLIPAAFSPPTMPPPPPAAAETAGSAPSGQGRRPGNTPAALGVYGPVVALLLYANLLLTAR